MNETTSSTLRILVVTSCTGEKREKTTSPLTQTDFYDAIRLFNREKELATLATPASQLYTGAQHLQAMEGVNDLRQALGSQTVDVVILSAGYGLISENRVIVPYEVSFNTMTGQQIDEWSRFLNIHSDLEQTIQHYDLIFVLLGENYIRSLSLPIEVTPEQTFVFLTSQGSLRYVDRLEAKKFAFPLSNVEAKHYRYGLVGLKGFLFKKFAAKVKANSALIHQLYQEPHLFKELIDSGSTQLELPLTLSKESRQPNSEEVVSSKDNIFNFPPALNAGIKMQYFIPEWDDHVDPDYDFITDTHLPERNIYEDEVYAHEIFDQPNYDGILVSKVIVEKSKTKKQKINL